MAGEQQNPQLLAAFATLKQLVKSRGFGYGDLARAFGVSERTVGRWLSNGSFTIEQLEKLCGLLEIDMFDFWELASRKTESRPKRLTARQERELSEDPEAIFVFTHLLSGWTPEELRREANIPETVMITLLARLERIGVIENLGNNRIRLLTAKEIEWLEGGPMKRAVNGYINFHFKGMNVNEPGFLCRTESLKLSVGSIAEIESKFQKLSSEIRQLARIDMSRSSNDKRWYAVLLAARSKALGVGVFQ
jgi:transcriptional regulator with XRE-family HTH domain